MVPTEVVRIAGPEIRNVHKPFLNFGAFVYADASRAKCDERYFWPTREIVYCGFAW